MIFFGVTDIGKVRKINEDAFYASDSSDVFYAIVADGMGGHNAGEVASKIAINTAKEHIENNKDRDCKQLLKEIFELANKKIYEMSKSEVGCENMGTTMICAIARDRYVYIGHVGDSSAYNITKDSIIKVTTDHTIVQELVDKGSISEREAQVHPQKNMITRAVGTDAAVDADIYVCENKGIFVIATDGLTGVVEKDEMKDVVSKLGVENAAKTLLDMALSAGGQDNITILVFSDNNVKGDKK